MMLSRSVFTLFATPRWTGKVVRFDLLGSALGELVALTHLQVSPVAAEFIGCDQHRRGATTSNPGNGRAKDAQQRPAP